MGLLRTHVGDRPRRILRVAVIRALKLRDTKIDKLRYPRACDDHVRRLDIAMDHSSGVRGFERACELLANRRRFLEANRLPPRLLLQSLAVVPRHRDERPVVFGVRDLVDDPDIRVVQCGGGAGFRKKTCPRTGVR